jgi:hypothetical protein
VSAILALRKGILLLWGFSEQFWSGLLVGWAAACWLGGCLLVGDKLLVRQLLVGQATACWSGNCLLVRQLLVGQATACWSGDCLLVRQLLVGQATNKG